MSIYTNASTLMSTGSEWRWSIPLNRELLDGRLGACTPVGPVLAQFCVGEVGLLKWCAQVENEPELNSSNLYW